LTNYADISDTKGINSGIRTMGINITHTMNNLPFENRENLRDAAKNILNRHGASNESVQNIFDKTIFNSNGQIYSNTQLAIIKASAQVSKNQSLKETLKYLKSHAGQKKAKAPVLGELWDTMEKSQDSYEGDLVNFVIDESLENIFAAA